jgi:hypothetical protein
MPANVSQQMPLTNAGVRLSQWSAAMALSREAHA